jgi:uncharacterized protein YbbC (DUF1343 family)
MYNPSRFMNTARRKPMTATMRSRFGYCRTIVLAAAMIFLCAAAFEDLCCAGDHPHVLNGIDVLRQQGFTPLKGKRIGLITNHTGLAADGISTIDLLFRVQGCKLAALFSPEHGIRGALDSKVSSSRDEATGLPIFSLYGDSTRPTAGSLKELDALVYDIQDIGARFYTYSTTLAYCMEEAARAGIAIYVLDRPNPIGGLGVEGPMLDGDKTSFIGYMPLPVRHGMTVGELARYFNEENKIGADLHVIEMTGWRRDLYFYSTGQVWVNPSPNMRSLTAAILYPGVCLLEATNISVGRGTERPFEILGAPWIEPCGLGGALNAAGLHGVKFVPLFFVPAASTNQGLRCGGVQLIPTDPEDMNSVLVGLTIVSVLQRMYPQKFEIDKVLRLLGNGQALSALKAGQSPTAVLEAGNAEVAGFLARRKRALIYDASDNPKEGRR